jgi:thioredoxin 1
MITIKKTIRKKKGKKMSENLLELTNENFEAKTAQGVVLIDFWAPWCGPCKMLGPVLSNIAAEIGDKATIAKINVDEAPQLAQRFGVRSIPAIFILKDGQTIEQFVGVQDKQKLITAIETAL